MPRLARTIHLDEPVEGVDAARDRLRRAGKYVYRAGEVFDAKAAAAIDPDGRPGLWQPEEAAAPVTSVADSEQDTGGDGQETEPQSSPDEPAGDGSPSHGVTGPPPRSGPSASTDNWKAYADIVGVHVEADATRDDIIAELETRGLA